jgi:hypothetical protein
VAFLDVLFCDAMERRTFLGTLAALAAWPVRSAGYIGPNWNQRIWTYGYSPITPRIYFSRIESPDEWRDLDGEIAIPWDYADAPASVFATLQ